MESLELRQLLSVVTLSGGTGNDPLVLQTDSTGTQIEFLQNGSVQYTQSLSTPDQLVLDGDTGTHTLTIDSSVANVIPLGLTFDASSGANIVQIVGRYGAGDLTLGSGTATVQSDDFDSTDAISFGVDAGTLTFGTSQRMQSLDIAASANAVVAGGGGKVLVTGSLSIAQSGTAWTGTLDLKDNDLIIDYSGSSPESTVFSQVKSGVYSGTGIKSTATIAYKLVGMAEASDLSLSTFAGVHVDADAILVSPTYLGDANLNGVMDADDTARLNNGFANGLTGWVNGDFNYTGTINGDDYALHDRSAAKLNNSVVWSDSATVGSVYTITLPTSTGAVGTVTSWTIDWGDGVTQTGVTTTTPTHTYATAAVVRGINLTAFGSISITYAPLRVAVKAAAMPGPSIGATAPGTPGGVAFGADGGDPMAMSYSGGAVRYSDGFEYHTTSDLDPAEMGMISGMTRTWSSDPARRDVSSALGDGWLAAQWPQLTQDPSGTTVTAVDGGSSERAFDFDGTSYAPRGFVLDQLTKVGTDFQLTDTLGNVTLYYGFDPSVAAELRGKVKQYTDAGGNVTVFTYDQGQTGAPFRLTKVERKLGPATSTTVLEELDYSYPDPQSTLVTDVSMRRADKDQVLFLVRSVHYDYQDFGDLHLLRMATITNADFTVAEYKAYRYDARGRLTYVLEGESFMRAATELSKTPAQIGDPSAVPDVDLAPYADLILAYDGSNRLTAQTIKGAGTYTYSYGTPSVTASGTNEWKYKTTETLPDDDGNSANDDYNVVYSNSAGEVLASVFVDGHTGSHPQWVTAYQYDDDGRLLTIAHPSAVTGTINDTLDDIVTPVLSSSDGLIDVNSYDANGYLQYTAVRHGIGGSDNKIEAFTYDTQMVGPVGPLVKTDTLYRDESNGHPITTTYGYTFSPAVSTWVTGRTIILPSVSTAQNGDGSTTVQESETFDSFGRRVQLVDGDSFTHEWTYVDSTGALKSEKVSGTGLPAGGLVTAYESDGLGRITQITEPMTTSVTTIEYKDRAEYSEVKTTPPLTTSGGASPPVQIVRADHETATVDVLTISSASGSLLSLTRSIYADPSRTPGSSQPDTGLLYAVERYESPGSLAYSETSGVTGTGPKYRTEYAYDARGQQTRVIAGRDLYTTTSMADTHPTITSTVYDALGRPVEVWVGTDDTVSGNMTKVTAYEYDGGGVGDGNVTKVTRPTDGTSADDRIMLNAYDWRDRLVATKDGAQTGESTSDDVNRPLAYTEYDNLDRPVVQYVFDGDGITPSVSMPSGAALRAATLTQYDDRGRVFRSSVFSIDQTSGGDPLSGLTFTQAEDLDDGGIGDLDGLRTDFWYDNRDNVIKSKAPGGLVTKNVYDAAGRLVTTYATDGGGDTAYTDAKNVTGDVVLEQVDTTYDDNGNAILIATSQRWHEEDAQGTGALQPGDLFDSSKANARVSFVANWYDEADRLVTSVDYGNNGDDGDSDGDHVVDFVRPSDAPGRTYDANGWDPYLQTDYSYDDQGYLEFMTDPRGIKTRHVYDALGRQTQLVEAYVSGGVVTADNNPGTSWTYNGFDQVETETLTTYNTRNQQTVYTYGVVKDATPPSGRKQNFINSSALLSSVEYVNTTGAVAGYHNKETYDAYDAQGELAQKTLADGAVHQYTIDVLGRLTADQWSNYGSMSNVNQMSTWATQLTYAYDTLGRVVTAKTFGPNSTTTPVNQVDRQYDGLGNLTSDATTINEDAYGGGVSATITGSVQYVYDNDFDANRSRLLQTEYPNGRLLWTDYGTAGGVNDRISRVETLADGPDASDALESYRYLGLGTVVERSYDGYGGPQFTGQKYFDTWITDGDALPEDGDVDDAGMNDPYNGLDRFGRVVEQSWVIQGLDRVAKWIAYDADSNPLYLIDTRRNASGTYAWQDELYQANGDVASDPIKSNEAYDQLGRMRAYSRGFVTTTSGDRPDTVSATNLQYSDNYSTDSSGNYARTTNPAHGQTFQGNVPLNPMAAPSDGEERTDTFAKFDGWGRLAIDTAAQFTALSEDPDSQWAYQGSGIDERQFEYDAFGRRIVERYIGSSANEKYSLYLFNDANGRVIEEQLRQTDDSASSAYTKDQYVWSDAGANLMVLRDSNADGLDVSGDRGKEGSGLEERIWVEQGPDGSVWEITSQYENGTTGQRETFLYTPEGMVSVVEEGSSAPEAEPASNYGWRYLWKGGRAEVFPFENGSETDLRYDGLLLMPGGGGEHSTALGSTFGEDVYAYHRGGSGYNQFVQWTYEQAHDPSGGNGGYYIQGQAYDPHMEAYTPPAWERPVVQTTRFVGIAAISVATAGLGTALAAAGLGAGIGGIDAALGGGNFAEGAVVGAEFGMGIAGALSLLPATAAWYAGVGLNVGLSGYGAYQSFSGGNNAQGLFRLATGAYFGLRQFGYDISLASQAEPGVVTLNARLLPFRVARARAMADATAADRAEMLAEDVPFYLGRAGVIPEHHIATIYEGRQNWATQFARIFRPAAMSLNDPLNRIEVPGHVGPHPEAYHQYVLDFLSGRVSGRVGTDYAQALRGGLMTLRGRVTDPADVLNQMITGQK